MARAAFGGQWPAFQAGSPAHGCTAIHGPCSLWGPLARLPGGQRLDASNPYAPGCRRVQVANLHLRSRRLATSGKTAAAHRPMPLSPRPTSAATRRQRGAARAPGAGVADERSHGWRSEVSIERAKPRMGGVSVRRRGTGSPSPMQEPVAGRLPRTKDGHRHPLLSSASVTHPWSPPHAPPRPRRPALLRPSHDCR